MKYQPSFTKTDCLELSADCLKATTLESAADILETAATKLENKLATRGLYNRNGSIVGSDWVNNMRKLAKALRAGRAGYTIFAKGNSKLPFYSYSELPQFTCPGAGECLKFCYSFTAWRYPAAFMRQLQNTILMRLKRSIIATDFNTLPTGTTVRLYVDGDIANVGVLGFWFGALNRRGDIDCYGYSKSWEVFKQWHAQNLPWPPNYCLNVSGGSRYSDDTDLKDLILSLPIARGEFIAVSIKGSYAKGFARFDDKSYHDEVRAVGRVVTNNPRVFSCTGKCGDCLPNGKHACGVVTLKMPIVIAEHN